MAEGCFIENKSLEELESEIKCGICQELYSEPKILPCLHYYCRHCILTLAQRSATGEPFYCPECRCAATLPEGGVDQLKTAFFINRLKSKVTTIERVQGKVEVKCELCVDSTSNAESFCRQCAMFICKECVIQHTKFTILTNHDIASLDDLKHGRAKAIVEKEPTTEKCEIHEKKLKVFCFDCNCLICQHCTVKDHKDHDFEFTKKAALNTKTKLISKLELLKKVHTNLTQGIEKIGTITQEVEAQNEAIISTIHMSFQEMHNTLEKCEKELVKEVNILSQVKAKKLSIQQKNLSLASTEVQSVVEYTERCVNLSTDNEVMSMHTEIEKAIQQKIQEHNEPGSSLEPVEVADMGVEVRCAETLKQFCQANVIITKLLDPAKCTVGVPEHAEVGKLSTATLITRLTNNKQAKGNCKISSQIKSLHNGVTIDCNVDEDGSGRYSIQCTPTVRGRHELTVLIDGQHVAGSPFPVYVSIHPTQLGKPVKVWRDLTLPLGITANSKGEILTTELKENIFKLTADGHRKKLPAVKELHVLCGIACDDEDNIYCIDEETNKIFTCDKNGGNRKIRKVDMDKISGGRRALLISNNEIIISEGKQGTVKVYDRNLRYVRTIGHKDMGEISSLATDLQGNIYATDVTNVQIHVFSHDGSFMRSICIDKKQIKYSRGTYFFGQYIYMTDINSHCVFVFTTDGEYVTSFGQLGTKEGDFNSPWYLHVDQDGFVFVADMFNDRVQCF